MEVLKFKVVNKEVWQEKALNYFQRFSNVVFINSNDNSTNLIAVSNSYEVKKNEWQFGFVSYDYKNRLEKLTSNNFDGLAFPEFHFFSPEILIKVCEEIEVHFDLNKYTSEQINEVFQAIEKTKIETVNDKNGIQINSRIHRKEYLQKVKKLKEHIQLGDIYEVNLCQEFYSESVALNPVDSYFRLNKKSPTPFSCFVKCEDNYLMCASPERYIQKTGDKIISQPIKGTIRKGRSEEEDIALMNQLKSDPKELSENVMIVDLVRNDLSKISKKGTVRVEELFGIYSFPQVHQMISTISGVVNPNISFAEVLKATFPMGSMTGAPKVRAMKLIEQYEETKRGLFSGTVGYITPDNDFNFNVVIRSILYNTALQYLSYQVGSAITINSNPKKEYEECLLKAKAINQVLNNY